MRNANISRRYLNTAKRTVFQSCQKWVNYSAYNVRSKWLSYPNVGELYKGLICLVSAVKIDLTLIDVYIIRDKAYYFFNFRVLERKVRNSRYQVGQNRTLEYLVELCCIFFIVVLRWFTSTLSIQEPLKTNSASTIPIIPLRRDFGYCKLHQDEELI